MDFRKNVLIICSNPVTGVTMKDPLVQTMLVSFCPDGYNPTYLSGKEGDKFPDNLPEGMTFSLILFAGCNVMSWLFNLLYGDTFEIKLIKFNNGIIKLEKALETNGQIIFVESEKFIKTLGSTSRYIPTTQFETLRYIEQYSLSQIEIKEKEILCNVWNEHFLFTITEDKKYGYYVIRPKSGGYRNRKKRTTRKQRHKKIRNLKNKRVSTLRLS